MIKPERLHKGDTVAVVSLSSGSIGEEGQIARYYQGKRVLEEVFGLKVKPMPNALKGTEYVRLHPEKRAKDLMDAFKDPNIKGIISMIGGDDTLRILPFIDFEIIKKNPKVFMGFSDTTANHFMMRKAGLVSFYGPALACELSLKEIPPHTIETIEQTLFQKSKQRELPHYKIYANDPLDWSTGKLDIHTSVGYKVLQGKGKVCGELIGGCFDTMENILGTPIWPKLSEFKGKILALESSDEQPEPSVFRKFLTNLGVQGIFGQINGIIVGRPKNGKFEEEYMDVLKSALKEFGRKDLPVLYNCHFGHAWLWNILPLGCKVEIDCTRKTLMLQEECVK